MSESLKPSSLDEFIDLSEQTKLSDSVSPNYKSPIENPILKNPKQLQTKETKHDKNKKKIKEEHRIKKIVAEDIQWFNDVNTVHQGELKCFEKFNDKYEGEIKCGVPHGHGLYIFDDGLSYYDGEFEFGKYHGFGVLHNHSGNHYVGNWCENSRSNFGKQVYENGDIYEGNWGDNKFHGYGTLEYKDGSYYHGNWEEGHKNGYGVFKWADGTAYNGEWYYDSAYKGVIYYPNGCRLEGVFRNESVSDAKFFDENGTCFTGTRWDIYYKYLQDLDWHFETPKYLKLEVQRSIEREEEKKRIEIAEEKKIMESFVKKPNIINENKNRTTKWYNLFSCFRSKNKKLD